MNKDPIVEEVRKVREAYAAEFDFDLNAMAEDLRKQQAKGGRVVVNLKPRKPLDHTSSAA
jgi:hypothetical protein